MTKRLLTLLVAIFGPYLTCHAAVMISGTGTAGNWTTEFLITNPTAQTLPVSLSYLSVSPFGCTIVQCPALYVNVPANGTTHVTFDDFPADVKLSSPLQTTYVTSNPDNLATVRARNVNRLTGVASELPVARLDSLIANDNGTLIFPGATQDANTHVNLVITEEIVGSLTLTITAFDASGSQLGSLDVTLQSGDSVFPLDVLRQLGVDTLVDGSIKVTRTGGVGGVIWGVMAVVENGATPVLVAGKNL